MNVVTKRLLALLCVWMSGAFFTIAFLDLLDFAGFISITWGR